MEEPKETFNMAVATLMRLDGILRRMEIVSETFSGVTENRFQIKLIRHFFLNAIPLLGIILKDEPATIEQYKRKVFSFKVPSKLYKGKRIHYYSSKLDDEIFSVGIEIQLILKGYFMPTSKKRRMF